MSGEITSAAFASTTLCLLVDGEIHTLPYSDIQIISPTGYIAHSLHAKYCWTLYTIHAVMEPVMEPVGDRHLAGRSIHMAGVCIRT